MRIGVIGAGAVGGVLAAVLHRAGHEVEVSARGEHLTSIIANGLHLHGAWGEYTARVDAHETLHQAADLVILTTKAQDATTALLANHRVANGTAILVVQNGLAGIAGARETCPDSPVAGALALFAASFLAPGEVSVTASAPTYIGGENPAGMASALSAQAFNGVIPVVVDTTTHVDSYARHTVSALSPSFDPFVGAQWTKLIVNQINALPAITGLSAQEVIGNASLVRIMTASMREAVRVGLETGVRFGPLLGLNHRTLSVFAGLPLWLGRLLPQELARRMGAVPNPGSTLQSIRRGQRTEIDYLNGAIVDAACAASLPAPVNACLVELVHEVERSGVFLAPDEVAQRVSSAVNT
ncbi:MAG: ketopantoate reductase family protein [Microbacteriaceae bacterium]